MARNLHHNIFMLSNIRPRSSILKMVNFFAILILLLPIVTASSDHFWSDVDMIHNDLSDHTQLTTNVEVPQHSSAPNENRETQMKRLGSSSRKTQATVSTADVEKFKQTLIIDKSYPENISHEEVENKLVALGEHHEWLDLDAYSIVKYSKYWAKVCVYFQNKPLVMKHRHYCAISPSYGVKKKRKLKIRQQKQYLDLLYCKCHNYIRSYRDHLSDPEIFLVHKGNGNEFFIFEQNVTEDDESYLFIKDFKGGVILPKPLDDEYSSANTQFDEKHLTFNVRDIEVFKQSLTIDNSYPGNLTLVELEDKFTKNTDIQNWPALHKYNLVNYSNYWLRVCGFFWDKKLDRTLRHSCAVSHSFGSHRLRKLFINRKILHFDLLSCKCHSYKTNRKYPESPADTFLIYQCSANEFFVFEQRATVHCRQTLFLKNFIGGVTLSDPDTFW